MSGEVVFDDSFPGTDRDVFTKELRNSFIREIENL